MSEPKGIYSRILTPEAVQNSETMVVVDPETGNLKGIDRATGKELWVQAAGSPLAVKNRAASVIPNGRNSYKATDKILVITDQKGNKVNIGYDPSILKNQSKIWPYIEEVALEIARLISEGETLKAICSREGFPPINIVAKWRVAVPGFKALIEEARKIRAEMFHDDLVETVEKVDESNAKSSKVKIDGLKHLAAIDDQDTYGNRTKVVGDKDAPLNFVFNTGIQRNAASKQIAEEEDDE